jgi:hypothetical protein
MLICGDVYNELLVKTSLGKPDMATHSWGSTADVDHGGRRRAPSRRTNLSGP